MSFRPPGGEGAEWEKALAWSRNRSRKSSLRRQAEAGGTRTPTGTQVLSGAEVAAAVAAAPDIPLETPGEQAAPPGLDFDLGLGAPAEAGAQPELAPSSAAAPTSDVTADLGFDLDLGGEEKKPEAAPAAAQIDVAGGGALVLDTAPGAPEAPASIDFDFELPATGDAAPQPQPLGETPPATAQAPAAPAEGGGGIDFDSPDPPAPGEKRRRRLICPRSTWIWGFAGGRCAG